MYACDRSHLRKNETPVRPSFAISEQLIERLELPAVKLHEASIRKREPEPHLRVVQGGNSVVGMLPGRCSKDGRVGNCCS